MDRDTFARKNGFRTFSMMLKASKVVVRDFGMLWLVTPTEFGYLAWVDELLDKPLGYFDTLEQAKQEIKDVRALQSRLGNK